VMKKASPEPNEGQACAKQAQTKGNIELLDEFLQKRINQQIRKTVFIYKKKIRVLKQALEEKSFIIQNLLKEINLTVPDRTLNETVKSLTHTVNSENETVKPVTQYVTPTIHPENSPINTVTQPANPVIYSANTVAQPLNTCPLNTVANTVNPATCPVNTGEQSGKSSTNPINTAIHPLKPVNTKEQESHNSNSVIKLTEKESIDTVINPANPVLHSKKTVKKPETIQTYSYLNFKKDIQETGKHIDPNLIGINYICKRIKFDDLDLVLSAIWNAFNESKPNLKLKQYLSRGWLNRLLDEYYPKNKPDFNVVTAYFYTFSECYYALFFNRNAKLPKTFTNERFKQEREV